MSIDIQESPRRDGSSDPVAVGLFVSYNSRDRAAVQEVRRQLGARGVSVFYDRESLGLGLDWFEPLERALGRVRGVVVLLGPNGLGRWQRRERALALDRQTREATFPVIPVLLPESKADDYSGFLLLNTYADLRGGVDNPDTLDAIVDTIVGDVRDTDRVQLPKTAAICPYRGLNAFREEDAPLFFGRDRLVDEPEQGLLHKVLTCPLVAVVGASGSGKSSVVRAGLLPRLRRLPPSRGKWEVVTFRPEKFPFLKLAIALEAVRNPDANDAALQTAAAGLAESWSSGRLPLEASLTDALEALRVDRLVVVVDQFEELITLTSQEARRSFLSRLLEATEARSNITVLLTLRTDYYSAIHLDPRLSKGVQRGIVNVGAMTRDELRSAIEGPAQRVGLEFEPGLVSRLLKDVGDEPGNLPLLEFALTELWEGREERRLTNTAYEKRGHVAGALDRRAEDVFKKLTERQKDATPRLFCRLVRVADVEGEGRDTCRRVRLDELDEESRSAFEPFVEGRLLVTACATGSSAYDAYPDNSTPSAPDDLTTVEVAHEALIHQWKRLRDWIREHREFLLWRERLKSQVTQWLRSGRDPDLLYHGAELDVAIEWDEKRHPELNQLEIEFIDASRRARDAAEADAHHRSVRMKRLMGIAIVVLLIVAVVAIYFVGKYANQLADGHLRVLVYAAQGVASTVLWDLERLSGPVLEAANDPKLRDLLKDNKVKCPPNPKECRLIDAMIKNNDVQPWLKSHREEIDRLEKLRNNNKENVVKQNGVQCWLQDYAEKISLKQGKYLAFENYYVLDGEGKLLADSWHGGKKQPTEQPTVWEPNAKAIGKKFPFRDYFLGAMSHRGREERASVHISRVYQAVSDGCYKFSISAPVHDKNPGSPPLGVVVVTIATLPELGHLLKDKWVTNVLVGREDINPFSDSGPASQPDRYHGYDLRLMPPVNDVNGIPTGGKNLIIVAAVNRVLHFRIFDGDGKVVVDTDEKRLTEQARLIKSLGKQLEILWPSHVLTTSH